MAEIGDRGDHEAALLASRSRSSRSGRTFKRLRVLSFEHTSTRSAADPMVHVPQEEEARMASSSKTHDKSTDDNRSRQLNPEHDAYRRSRGEPERPEGDPDSPPNQDGGGRKPS